MTAKNRDEIMGMAVLLLEAAEDCTFKDDRHSSEFMLSGSIPAPPTMVNVSSKLTPFSEVAHAHGAPWVIEFDKVAIRPVPLRVGPLELWKPGQPRPMSEQLNDHPLVKFDDLCVENKIVPVIRRNSDSSWHLHFVEANRKDRAKQGSRGAPWKIFTAPSLEAVVGVALAEFRRGQAGHEALEMRGDAS